MPSNSPLPSRSELFDELSSLGAGLGLITTIGFPFALPAIALTLLLLAVVAIPAVVVGLLAAVLLAPVMLLRSLRARRRRRLTAGRAGDGHANRSLAMESGEGSLVTPASQRLPEP